MKRIALDVDGVLCQFHEFCIEIAKKKHGLPSHFTTEHVRHWDITKTLEDAAEAIKLNKLIQSPGFALLMPPYPEAIQAVYIMRRLGVEVIFATSPNYFSKTWMWERKLWLKQHFNAPEEDIVFVHKKHLVRANAFVDDKLSAVREWCLENPDGKGFVWDKTYNRDDKNDVLRTDVWETVIEAVTS
ncbi:MAG TPA: hypothetical protein VIE65_04095 [Methylobacter sp.]|jgi:5'(3')-deoxyribonucleotidase